MLTAIEQIGAALDFLRASVSGTRVDPEFLADVREFLRIGEAPVRHHRAQCIEPGVGEEQHRQAAGQVEPHQPAIQQPLGGLRDLGLPARTAAPVLQLESLRHARQRREEHIEFAADVVPLTRRKVST